MLTCFIISGESELYYKGKYGKLVFNFNIEGIL